MTSGARGLLVLAGLAAAFGAFLIATSGDEGDPPESEPGSRPGAPSEDSSAASSAPGLARAASSASAPWFVEDAEKSGIAWRHVAYSTQRFDFPEIMSGGVGLLDADADGALDVYLVQGGDLRAPPEARPGDVLYMNRGNGTFEDVTERAGVGDRGYGMGCAAADCDGDGDTDLYVTNVGPNVLYRNRGDGTFADDARAAGVQCGEWSSSAAFLDYDADGALDLLVARYILWSPERELECGSGIDSSRDYCHPNNYAAPLGPRLFHNRGDGGFDDVTERAGLARGEGRAQGNGLGVAFADLDTDGDVDFYLANDMQQNELWLNRGDGTFVNEAFRRGCALDKTGQIEAGMGIQAVDLENDGDFDLYVSNMKGQSNTFYRNDVHRFVDVTAQLGLQAHSLPFTGFGLGFHDFDHDGRLDLFTANGAVRKEDGGIDPSDVYAMPNSLLSEGADGRFHAVEPAGGSSPVLLETSRACAFGDLDGDGDVDIVVVNRNERVHLLRNVAPKRGHWVLLRVLDRRGSDAQGALVTLVAGGKRFVRLAQSGYSYCASNDPRVHVGLGEATRIESVDVKWPGGGVEEFGPFEVGDPGETGRILELRQGEGRR